MKFASIAAAVGLAAAAIFSYAQTGKPADAKADKAVHGAVESGIASKIEAKMGVHVDGVAKTSYADLYEVRLGSDILYTDKSAKYLVFGKVIDIESKENLTEKRIAELGRINFADLPLASAVKLVKGNGKNVIAVFEDPHCGYCKRLRRTLAGMNDVTVYTFMYNILSDDSKVKSHNIWCSKSPSEAWDDWMINNVTPADAPAGCNSPNDAVYELGQKLHINGTPTIFFTDGTRVPGAMEQAKIEAKFAELAKK